MGWKHKVSNPIKIHLGKYIAETIKDKKTYEEAPDPGNAQLWVAIANLGKDIFELDLRLKNLENIVKVPKKSKKKTETDSKN